MSYARLMLAACTAHPLPQSFVPLPPRHEVNPLIDWYFNTVFVLLPIFDETSFYTSVTAVYNADDRRPASPFDFWILRIVLAIASISRSEHRGDNSYVEAVGHMNAALKHAEDVLHPGSVESIQALLVLFQYATCDPHHLDAWTIIGAASRAMVDLGMHQDPPKPSAMPRARTELRRRVYYCVYALDRCASLLRRVALTKAHSIRDLDLQQ